MRNVAHMQEHIIDKPSWELDAIIDPTLPIFGGIEVDRLSINIDTTTDSQARIRRPLKRHRCSRRSKVSNDHEFQHIVASRQKRSNVQRVKIPDQRTASARSYCYSASVHVKLVFRVC